MSNVKTAPAWTPGPWRVVRPVTPTDGFTLWSGEDRVALTGPATSLECEAANARLIAAAPDLAEALDGLHYNRRGDGSPCWCSSSNKREEDHAPQCNAARAALARARGKS